MYLSQIGVWKMQVMASSHLCLDVPQSHPVGIGLFLKTSGRLRDRLLIDKSKRVLSGFHFSFGRKGDASDISEKTVPQKSV